MNATGLLHLRRKPLPAQWRGMSTWTLPLIERQERSVEAEIEVTCVTEEARAWVEAHRADLVAGVSLRVELQHVRARGNVLRGQLHHAPEIAPPRYPAPEAQPHPATHTPAVPA